MKLPLINVVETVPSVANIAAGPSYSVVSLCKFLIDRGINITLADTNFAEGEINLSFIKRFKLSKLWPKHLGASKDMLTWLKIQAQENQIDLLHNHSLWMMPNIYPGWIAKKYNIPLVISPRGTLSEKAMQTGSKIKKLFWPLFQKPVLDNATCFHATSEAEYLDIRRLGFKQPVAVIPNGMDLFDLPERVLPEQKTLLFLGRIHEVKGLDMLLAAWFEVQDVFPEWNLKIVGPSHGNYVNKLKDLSSKLNLNRVEFSDAVMGSEKWATYRNADVFILPSYTENFAVAVAEALSMEVPVIATKGTPWQILEEYLCGFWIDTNKDSIVKCLHQIFILDRNEISEMGKRGRILIEQKFAWDNIAKMMDDTYRWILFGGDKPSCVHLN